jgi:hypothetical protein
MSPARHLPKNELYAHYLFSSKTHFCYIGRPDHPLLEIRSTSNIAGENVEVAGIVFKIK